MLRRWNVDGLFVGTVDGAPVNAKLVIEWVGDNIVIRVSRPNGDNRNETYQVPACSAVAVRLIAEQLGSIAERQVICNQLNDSPFGAILGQPEAKQDFEGIGSVAD